MTDNKYIALKQIIDDQKKILIVSHVNPDGDAIGSLLGLFLFLKNAGCEVKSLLPNAAPQFLQWLPSYSEIILYDRNRETAEQAIKDAMYIICLDFNYLDRTSKAEKSIRNASAKKLLIDHHPNPENCFDFIISDTSVSSTAELIYKVIVKNNKSNFIDTNVATALFAGILTDTGCFSFNSSNPDTWRIVADLLEKGVSKNEVFSAIYDNFSIERMRLLGKCLKDNMVVYPELHAAYITLSLEDQKAHNFAPGDSEGFVNYPLSMKGIIFSILIMERDSCVKLSLRSKGSFNVNEIASTHFKGGGHINASGAESNLSLKETLTKIETLLPTYKDALENAYI